VGAQPYMLLVPGLHEGWDGVGMWHSDVCNAEVRSVGAPGGGETPVLEYQRLLPAGLECSANGHPDTRSGNCCDNCRMQRAVEFFRCP
jgi:hypothetical protein